MQLWLETSPAFLAKVRLPDTVHNPVCNVLNVINANATGEFFSQFGVASPSLKLYNVAQLGDGWMSHPGVAN